MRRLRAFEIFVMALVLGVVICFCIELSLIENASVGEVLQGYIPSSAVIKGDGIYLSCGILGATVMPHSLYLGSGIVQPRLRHFDQNAGSYATRQLIPRDSEKFMYRPSLAAIRSCMTYSMVEVGLCLFTFALFVNSAILIVAGASLSSNAAAESADLFGIHELLARTLAPVAGTIFALALLLSGTSAGIVCTIAGQMLSEGALNWTIAPWMRRLVTRSISITPSIIIAAAVGQDGLSDALNGTQVALSIALPFVSAPLIYFTCRNKYMVVGGARPAGEETEDDEVEQVKMRNHWIVSILAVAIWLVIAVMNIALLVLVGLGKM
jgi:metal iron transporter